MGSGSSPSSRSSPRRGRLDYVISRPHNVYGELQNIGGRYRNVLGIFTNQNMQGEPLSIFGDREQTHAFSYVADIIPAIADAPSTPGARGEVCNVCADVPTRSTTWPRGQACDGRARPSRDPPRGG